MGFQHEQGQYALEEQPDNVQFSAKMSAKKYCICRSTDGTGFMILCENCDEWFHGRCVNITGEHAEGIRHYYCTMCIAKNPMLKIRYKRSAMKNATGYRETEINDNDNSETPCTTKMYYVENILGKKLWDDGTFRYLVKWTEYDSSENTWEPLANLISCQDVLARFERRLKRRENGEASSSEDDLDNVDDGSEAQSGSSDSDSDSDSSSSEAEEHLNSNGRKESGDENDEGDARDGDSGENRDDDKNKEDKGNNQEVFSILDELPEDKEPTEVLLTIPLRDGRLAYMVECKNRDDELEPVFVHAKLFRLKYPQLLIAFYQQHAKLTEDAYVSDDEDFDLPQTETDKDDDDEAKTNSLPAPSSPSTKRKIQTLLLSESSSSNDFDASSDSSDDEVLADKPKRSKNSKSI